MPEPDDLIERCRRESLALLERNLVPQGILAASRTAAASLPDSWRGPMISSRAPARLMGEKNGMPCTWSQCRWLTSAMPSKGDGTSSAIP